MGRAPSSGLLFAELQPRKPQPPVSPPPGLRFRAGDLDLPERKNRYANSREEEEEGAQMCPCCRAKESRSHIVGEREMYKEERDVLEEEMRTIDECDVEKFDTLDSSEKTIAILGDRWWPQTAK